MRTTDSVKRRFASVLCVWLLAETLLVAAASACGPFPMDARFRHLHHPDDPARFLAGDLGVLDRDYNGYYHYVAWRRLSGLDVDPTAVPQARDTISRMDRSQSAIDQWMEARSLVVEAAAIRRPDRERWEQIQVGSNSYYSGFPNCLDDAFRTAAETLQDRVERFGASSPEIQEWLRGQDMVFSNCGEGENIPSSLDGRWDSLTRADRDYQIGAAYFYSRRFADAEQQFRLIAADPASPWSKLADYLVARALIRDLRHGEAETHLRSILDDPAMQELYAASQRLINWIRHRNDREGRRAEILQELQGETMPPHQTWIDYTYVSSMRGEEPGSLEVWLDELMHDSLPGVSRARGHWKSEGSWRSRIPALLLAEKAEEGLLAEVDASGAAPPEAIRWTFAYHRARLLAAEDRLEEARADLDAALSAGGDAGLSLSDLNRFRRLRRELAADLDEYLELAQMEPVEVGYDTGFGPLLTHITEFPHYGPGGLLLDSASTQFLNRLRTDELLEIVRADRIDSMLRRRLATVVWTRAVVLEDWDSATEVAPIVAETEPLLQVEMNKFLAAAPEDRAFDAVMILLRTPGLHPDLHYDIGRLTPIKERDALRDNWWCAGDWLALDPDASVPAFLTPDVRRDEETKRLASIKPGANHLGDLVLRRAETHPNDSRLPEALHRVVQATRYSCYHAEGYRSISQSAFTVLHKRFADSVWAEKTPYWFE